jgi:hypothetical protein
VSANPTLNERQRLRAAVANARRTDPVDPDVGALWVAQAGSQEAFLSCPFFEVLYHGTRGGGKTDALLMAFAKHVGQGYGAAWRGVIFRQTYPQLGDVIAKAEKWFPSAFPGARYNATSNSWRFPTGETLLFRHMSRVSDYWNYHGHEYPFIGFEELTNWPNDECYRKMMSCCRSSNPNVPRMFRATTNPYGVGHTWVKQRFQLDGNWNRVNIVEDPTDDDGNPEPSRCSIYSLLDENKALLEADPSYRTRITAAASNESMKQAWLTGSWDLTVGGMFDDIWSEQFNSLPRFSVPPSWRIDRALDWGSARPFSVGWYAVSDGSDLRLDNGDVMQTVRGDVFRIAEWYGWTKRPNTGLRLPAGEVARGIIEREIAKGWRTPRWCRVSTGIADSAIFATDNGPSVATDMARPIRIGPDHYDGLAWQPANKHPGSRAKGWEVMRQAIRNGQPPPDGGPRELPGFFVVRDENRQFFRTVLSLARSDRDLDDIDTDAEDHVADEVRYRLYTARHTVTSGRTVGHV